MKITNTTKKVAQRSPATTFPRGGIVTPVGNQKNLNDEPVYSAQPNHLDKPGREFGVFNHVNGRFVRTNKGYAMSQEEAEDLVWLGNRDVDITRPINEQRCESCKTMRQSDAHGFIGGWQCHRCRQTRTAQIVESGDDGQMSVEELQETWEDDKNGEYIQISDDGRVHYIAHGQAMEEITIEGEDPFSSIKIWMAKSKFWPNIWKVNERGNITLFTYDGKELGGLV